MKEDIASVLLTEEQIKARVAELGAQISRDYAGKELVMVGVLKGSVVFLADLMRAVTVPVSLDFMAVSSYGMGSTTSGAVRIIKDLDRPIEDCHVLIVEDILDSGKTLSYIMSLMGSGKPASVRLAALLDKPERRCVPVKCDYVGFTVPDEFLVGYGLDYAERYRNLPYIGVLARHVYEG